MSDLLEGLNEAQHQAITAPDGAVLVLAGPGSGKTRVLTHRVAWLVEEKAIPAWRIMAVTFTNKASKEMKHRTEDLLNDSLGQVWMGTFHGICARILRREADDHLPLTRDYVIFDTADQRALMKLVIEEDLNLDVKTHRPVNILNRISKAKTDRITADKFKPDSYKEEIVKRAYEIYQQKLLANNAVDFDDLLLHTLALLEGNQAVRLRYQGMFDTVLVDEFQDTNLTQYDLVKLLAGGKNNLFCVGDEDQSIYRWRGADFRNVLRLKDDYPGLQTILLEQNYRSTQVILDAARAVINRNTDRTEKKLFTEKEGGDPIIQYEAYSEQYEAQFVVDTIAELVMGRSVEPGECAVMYRTNAQSRVLEDAFLRANLPYRLVGAQRFYGRKEIKDIISYLRIIHNPEDTISLRRIINVPPRKIGKKTIETLSGWAVQKNQSIYGALQLLDIMPTESPLKKGARDKLLKFYAMLENWRSVKDTMKLGELLRLVLEDTGYAQYIVDGSPQAEDRWENIKEFANILSEFEEVGLATFLQEMALVADVDTLKEDVNAPTLMTFHAAKGLEFDVVFLVGLEENILPHSRSKEDPEQMAEERRLLYVGMTRARKRIYLSYAFQRTVWGNTELNLPSPFLDDIPEELVAVLSGSTTGSGYRQATTWGNSRPPRVSSDETLPTGEASYKAGQRVRHPKFGEGIVIECKPSGGDEEVSVIFDEGGMKRLMASYITMEILQG